MAQQERKGENQKRKLLYLMEIFLRDTDEEHPLTSAELIQKLDACGVSEDRKTLYRDMDELRLFGMDIVSQRTGHVYAYYLGQRQFELPELKLLVDSVQSAKFITERKSRELIHKLEGLVSRHQGVQLHRQVVMSGRVKADNEGIYYNVDRLHEAIGAGVQIRFQYFRWNLQKEMELRRDGAWYQVSPWALMWDDENYYLVAYDGAEGRIKHYRVDKMLRISATETRREGEEAFRAFDMPRYTKSLFGMFGGAEREVTIQAKNELVGVLLDRFGREISIAPLDEGHFQTVVRVAVSSQFLGWIMALGDGVRLTAPADVVERMREQLRRLREIYPDEG